MFRSFNVSNVTSLTTTMFRSLNVSNGNNVITTTIIYTFGSVNVNVFNYSNMSSI